MLDNSINIRDLSLSDIPDAMDLVLTEGWNQTIKDWQLLINNPQNVCLAAEIKGKLVGTATAINYNNEVAWIGMVLVNSEYRGRGIAKILLSGLFDQLKSCKSVKLDATPAGQPVYKKLGFEDEYLINRMVNLSLTGLPKTTSEIVPQKIRKEDIPSIIEFDKIAFGADRSQLIKSFITDYPEKSLMLRRNNQIVGFALGRQGNKYHQIGPVSAQSSIGAQLLITKALKDLQGHSVVIDILGDKQVLTEWLSSVGFVKQRDFMRMFKVNNPFPGEASLQYSISGPEFG